MPRNKKYSSFGTKEYKKAMDFLSDMHTSTLKAKDKVVAWLEKRGWKDIAKDVASMNGREYNTFVYSQVHEAKVRKCVREVIAEVLDELQ